MWRQTSAHSIKAKSTTFFCDEDIIEVTPHQLDRIKEAARQDPLKRARLCLHRDINDTVHEMVIALHRDSYVRPHRHWNKSESFHIIEGALQIIFLDDDGQVIRSVTMSADNRDRTFLYRLASPLWHTVVPHTEFVVFHETTAGPFVREDTEFPTWAPEETDEDGIRNFLRQLLATNEHE